MDWVPIEKYDAMKVKPKQFIVFLVAELKTGRMVLPQTISLDRRMGFRTITHFCVLPAVPDDGGVTVV
jgi:hypothetical protein